MRPAIDFAIAVDLKDSQAKFHYYKESLGINLHQAVIDIANQIKDKANKILETHKLNQHPELATIKDSWRINDIGKAKTKGVSLENWSPYASYAEYGTGIYPPGGKGIITPKHSRVMKFKWYPGLTTLTPDKDGYVYLPYILGQPPIAYFSQAYQEVMKEVRSIAEAYIRKSLI